MWQHHGNLLGHVTVYLARNYIQSSIFEIAVIDADQSKAWAPHIISQNIFAPSNSATISLVGLTVSNFGSPELLAKPRDAWIKSPSSEVTKKVAMPFLLR